MARYSARIELHDASESDYDRLHKAMWKAGFRRVVMSDDRKLYQLPTGSYIIETAETAEVAYLKAKRAAAGVQSQFDIWFVEFSAARFALHEVPRDPDSPGPPDRRGA